MVKKYQGLRRITPADDPSVRAEWLGLERSYLDQGLSRREAHERIARNKGVSYSAVYRHLSDYDVKAHSSPRSYADQKASQPRFLERQKLQNYFRNDAAKLIVPCYDSADQIMTLEELSVRLHDRFRLMPRISTLQRIAESGSPNTGKPVIEVASSTDPPKFRLTSGLYDSEKYRK